MADKSSTLVFYVNGSKVEDTNADPEDSLLYYLRNKLGLCGTKNGCSEGGCGACTVMLSKFNRSQKKVRHYSVNACLLPVCAVHGCAITTVEGIGSIKTGLHPVQERLAKGHGSQCGYCTPGFVMAMYSLLRNNPEPSEEEIEAQIQGNLCRCTGYRPIIQTFYSFSEEANIQTNGTNGCCKGMNGVCPCKEEPEHSDEENGLLANGFSDKRSIDSSQDVIFPPELQLSSRYDQQTLEITGPSSTWYRPATLTELIQFKATNPMARLVVGNSSVGIEKKYTGRTIPMLVYARDIDELQRIEVKKECVTFGASVSYSEVESTLKSCIANGQESGTRSYAVIVEMLAQFEYAHIKNVASWAGSVTSGSSTSDINPLLLATCSTLKVMSTKTRKERTIVFDGSFFLGYKKTALQPDDVVMSVTIPCSKPREHFAVFKQSQGLQRVTAAFRAVMAEDGSSRLDDIYMAFGGVGATPLLAGKTMLQAKNCTWNDEFLSKSIEMLTDEIHLPEGSPGGLEKFRKSLCLGFFFKFYVKVRKELELHCPVLLDKPLLSSQSSAWQRKLIYEPIKAIQVTQPVPDQQPAHDAVGRPMPHQSCLKQTTGEAVYTDDIEACGCLHIGLVLSSKAHAKIVSVDIAAALKVAGVIGVINASDIPVGGSNVTGIHGNDEEIFRETEVTAEGQTICAVVAETPKIAHMAARLVKVEYEVLPAILTIEEANAAESFLAIPRRVSIGDVESGFSKSDHVIEGSISMGGQEHFYMEPHSSICFPREDEIEAITSCQGTHNAQVILTKAIGIPSHKVVVKVKRIGGGFGGKELRLGDTLLPAAIAALKYRKPVKCTLQRDEDMIATGTRHPFSANYKVGFLNDGTIMAIKMDMFSNGGYSIDVSDLVAEGALTTVDASYRVPNINIMVHALKTNLPSNTAFRGFGRPQAVLIREQITTKVAQFLRIDPVKIRENSLYKDGDITPYGQVLQNVNVKRCWNECLERSDYYTRRKRVDAYNSRNRWVKRGITVMPLKYGIGMPTWYNQGVATVHIYSNDGSVLVTHGGVEMGQGLHTKLIQIASRALGIPIERIHINDTSSDKAPNATATAGSSGSDLFGGAVQLACDELYKRLRPYMEKDPSSTWNEWIREAYYDRVSLTETAFYRTAVPDEEYEKTEKLTDGRNEMFQFRYRYYTFGAACCEVEVDCLTGAHKLLRADIVMDIGQSINPAVDIGQIEGGFVQGYGLCTVEEHKYSKSGNLLTRGPGSYTIPMVEHIPRDFNIFFLKGSTNKVAVYSSKGLGEPPLILGVCPFFAIQDAVFAARKDVGLREPFVFDSPATAERIRLACTDSFLEKL